jgi:hypothetical protein
MDLLKTFAQDFTQSTGIKVHAFCDERTYPHWKRLLLPSGLTCEDMTKISNFIKEKFSQKGKYSHLLVTLGSHDGGITLTADVKDLERAYQS